MLARRFKAEHSPLDWAVLIQDIADTGMSKADIAEAVGMPRTVIVSLSNDMMQHSEKFDQAYALLDLWHRLHQNTKPLPEIK